MDDNIRTRKPGQSCWRFISRVAQDQNPSFIFTLNQDMFFERFRDPDKNTVFPGVPEHLGRFKEAGEDSAAFQLRLPNAEALEPRKAELKFAQIAYVKLHGSQGWLSHDGSDAMVIGAQKASRIENEPLLKWYFSLFEEVINRPETQLLTIGYGFRDEHINHCIVNAMDKGLKLYVVSPQGPQDFKNQFMCYTVYKVPLGNQLWNGLVQYWPAKITDFYYDRVNPPQDLNPRGRALFRSLGLIK
jgi:SIR2-like domain